MRYFVTNGKNNRGKKAYFYECQKTESPLIIVTHRQKYSQVHWDYITLPPHFDSKIVNNENLLNELKNIFQGVADDVSSYEMSAGHGTFYKLRREHADIAAKMIYAQLNQVNHT